jgi:uncharacterized membrane protein
LKLNFWILVQNKIHLLREQTYNISRFILLILFSLWLHDLLQCLLVPILHCFLKPKKKKKTKQIHVRTKPNTNKKRNHRKTTKIKHISNWTTLVTLITIYINLFSLPLNIQIVRELAFETLRALPYFKELTDYWLWINTWSIKLLV